MMAAQPPARPVSSESSSSRILVSNVQPSGRLLYLPPSRSRLSASRLALTSCVNSCRTQTAPAPAREADTPGCRRRTSSSCCGRSGRAHRRSGTGRASRRRSCHRPKRIATPWKSWTSPPVYSYSSIIQKRPLLTAHTSTPSWLRELGRRRSSCGSRGSAGKDGRRVDDGHLRVLPTPTKTPMPQNRRPRAFLTSDPLQGIETGLEVQS